ncbi:MAG TPA: hypothetical protein VK969_07335 [Acidimicrobiia bacterium]|nr:hypothetical protein [Acidimicrobiia bacterium]
MLALVGLSLVASCGSNGEESTPRPELTEQYACGYGFYASNVEQTVGLFIELSDFEAAQIGDVPETSQLGEDTWQAELRFGRDLFANWCDDVLEPGEPTPEVGETWQLSGTIEINELPPAGQGRASATLTGVEARGPNNELITFDLFEIENQFWGTIAG